jgi:hypothetical protein
MGRRLAKCLIPALAAPLVVLAVASSAVASEPTGEYAVFKDCPLSISHIDGCIYSVTTSGGVTIAGTTVPITNPIVFQGGETRLVVGEEEFRKFAPAADGETLVPTPQPVPGGLAGLIKCNEINEPVGRLTCELVFQNGLTGVNAVTELVGEADYKFLKLASHKVGLIMPVRVRLENPLLGSECYIGSAAEPITFHLTAGTTSPPPPNEPISGYLEGVKVTNGGRLVTAEKVSVVDNSFAVPTANGCGGSLLASVIDPIINAKLGLPSPAGHNSARLTGHVEEAVAGAVIESEGAEATAAAIKRRQLWLLEDLAKLSRRAGTGVKTTAAVRR